jgi:hypothetical protein
MFAFFVTRSFIKGRGVLTFMYFIKLDLFKADMNELSGSFIKITQTVPQFCESGFA